MVDRIRAQINFLSHERNHNRRQIFQSMRSFLLASTMRSPAILMHKLRYTSPEEWFGSVQVRNSVPLLPPSACMTARKESYGSVANPEQG